MLPMDQIRYSLNCPVPTSFTPLNDSRVSAVLFGGSALRLLSESEEKAFYSAYHAERLEFAGDRIWHAVIVEVLFLLTPVQPLVPPGEPSLAELQKEVSLSCLSVPPLLWSAR
jgi:dsRNA-specific ribonuclease